MLLPTINYELIAGFGAKIPHRNFRTPSPPRAQRSSWGHSWKIPQKWWNQVARGNEDLLRWIRFFIKETASLLSLKYLKIFTSSLLLIGMFLETWLYSCKIKLAILICVCFNLKSKKHVILKFGNISMTGGRLEECLQGGQDASEVIELLTKVLDGRVNDTKRIFARPVDKVKGFPMLSQTIVLKNSNILYLCFPLSAGRWTFGRIYWGCSPL